MNFPLVQGFMALYKAYKETIGYTAGDGAEGFLYWQLRRQMTAKCGIL